jgi:hypothetical protein
MTTPAWQAAENGPLSELAATNQAGQFNQLLGAHAGEVLYTGAGIDLPTHGGQNFQWYEPAENTDVDQAFVLSGTTVGRVVVPMTPAGNGADVLVTLYPDNGSGSPLITTPIAATRVPAVYQTQVAAPLGLPNGGPLATAANNNMFTTGGWTSIPWAPPASTINGFSFTTSYLVDGNYIISVGGQDNVTGDSVPTVFTTYYPGGANLDLPIPQPSLPVGLSGCSLVVCSGTLVVIGGFTTQNSALVYTASWDNNTGIIGSWSAQTVLPEATENAGVAASGSSIYCIGGLATVSQTVTANVYMNTVSNGQLGSWVTCTPLPVALSNIGCFAIAGWLVVFGGANASFAEVPTTYYAAIQADGSIGPWISGPNMVAGYTGAYIDFENTGQVCLADNTIVVISNVGSTQSLSVTADGPGQYWRASDNLFPASFDTYVQGAFSNGDGTYDVVLIHINNTVNVYTTSFVSVPMISIPLYASGLTSGHTYHVVLQAAQSNSASDYTSFGLINSSTSGSAYSANALVSARFSGSWSTIEAGSSIPMQVYDASAASSPLHVWSEPDPQFTVAQETTSLLYNRQKLVAGVTTVTAEANPPLNSNPTFTSGVTPWTALNGTITQSSAQTHGGYPFSGLLTPTGGFSQASALSELFPVTQSLYGDALWVYPTGYFYTPTTWANFSLSLNWYDSSQTLISTSSATVSLTGATWTSESNNLQPPSTAAYAQLAPTLSGTPTSSNTLYMSDVYLVLSPVSIPSFSSIATVQYANSGASWPPIGVTQLN